MPDDGTASTCPNCSARLSLENVNGGFAWVCPKRDDGRHVRQWATTDTTDDLAARAGAKGQQQ